MNNKNNHKEIIYLSLLIATIVICSNFLAVRLPQYEFNFAYLPMAIMGSFFSPWLTIIGMTLSDFIGTILSPNGSFFLGFTISSILVGLIYHFFLYNKKKSWLNIILASFIINFGVNLILNTLWLHIMYGTPFLGLLIQKIIPEILTFTLQTITLKLMFKYLPNKIFKF